MTLQRMSHTGAAPATTLSAGISSSATSFSIVSGTGYPTGSNGPFVLKIDAGTTSEEKILCSTLSGTTVTVASGGRGWDNTVASAHSVVTGAVEHDCAAIEIDDANDHIYTTTRDDHTQYLRVDGTRAGTGAQTIGGALTVTTGGASVGGNSSVTGNLTVSGSVSAASFTATGGTPIGGLVGTVATGPSVQTDFSSSGGTVLTKSLSLVNGQTYMLSLALQIATDVTAPGAPAQVYITDSLGYLPGTGNEVRAIAQDVNTSEQIGGGTTWLFSATATSSDTFTVSAKCTGGALRIPANNVQFSLIRVA